MKFIIALERTFDAKYEIVCIEDLDTGERFKDVIFRCNSLARAEKLYRGVVSNISPELYRAVASATQTGGQVTIYKENSLIDLARYYE